MTDGRMAALAGQDANSRLVRTVAVALLGTISILALYFGRDVLIPAAVAVLLAFILGPALTRLRRVLPLPMAVALVVAVAVLAGSLLAVLVFSQLADVAGSLTRYQSNLHQKVQDVRSLAQERGVVSQLMAMVASLAHDFTSEAGAPAVPAVQVHGGISSIASVASFVAPLLHPLLSLGIIVVLVIFILLDRDHLSDQFVRLFGASDVHATSQALGDAASRVARVLSLQLLTNFGFAVLVGVALFALGMPNAALWGLLAGAFRFVPYVGAVLGAVLPTLIAFAVLPGWLFPVLVLSSIVALDVIIGQVVEPLLFGESTGVTPLALILSAIFWGTLWGPIGLLLSTPLTICLLVLGKHVPHVGFLEVLLGDAPALTSFQQVYRRLIRKATADACTVVLAEMEEKGPETGLDDSLGRMLVLAQSDDALDRLSAVEVAAIVEGTDYVLDFLAIAPDEAGIGPGAVPGTAFEASDGGASLVCIGGRGRIDDAVAAVMAFSVRQHGVVAAVSGRNSSENFVGTSPALTLICYASHPSDSIRRYIRRKLPAAQALHVLHCVLDYDVAPAPLAVAGNAGPRDLMIGTVSSLSRSASAVAFNGGGLKAL